MKTMPSLLAPAGNMRALQTALRFGADAVYCINENHSLGEWFKKSLLAIMQKKKLLLLYNQEAVWQLQQGTTKGGHSNERHE